MAAKRKSVSSKAKWRAARMRYTWHLHPPFDQTFDRVHWWKQLPDSKIEPVAALYELARRHPLVGEGLLARMPTPVTRESSQWGDPNCPEAVFGVSVFILTCLFPPWQTAKSHSAAGYSLLFTPPSSYSGVQIDLGRLFLEWVVLAAVAGTVWFFAVKPARLRDKSNSPARFIPPPGNPQN